MRAALSSATYFESRAAVSLFAAECCSSISIINVCATWQNNKLLDLICLFSAHEGYFYDSAHEIRALSPVLCLQMASCD